MSSDYLIVTDLHPMNVLVLYSDLLYTDPDSFVFVYFCKFMHF